MTKNKSESPIDPDDDPDEYLRQCDQHLAAGRPEEALVALGSFHVDTSNDKYPDSNDVYRERLTRIVEMMGPPDDDHRIDDDDQRDDDEYDGVPRYVCDQCGACCRHSGFLDLSLDDVRRNPEWIPVSTPNYWRSYPHFNDEQTRVAEIHLGECPFLGADKRCTCYATRPDICREYEPGSDGCQHCRECAGLPPLEPTVPEPDPDEYDPDNDPDLWDSTLFLSETNQ